jgi:hypothetical protein
MNRFTHTLIRLRGLAPLAVGSLALTLAACATPGIDSTASAADLQAKADYHAMMAADYRARARVDEKHAIQWQVQANHCDQRAQAFRTAALAAGAAPRL